MNYSTLATKLRSGESRAVDALNWLDRQHPDKTSQAALQVIHDYVTLLETAGCMFLQEKNILLQDLHDHAKKPVKASYVSYNYEFAI